MALIYTTNGVQREPNLGLGRQDDGWGCRRIEVRPDRGRVFLEARGMSELLSGCAILDVSLMYNTHGGLREIALVNSLDFNY
jgi:hypothetical protein